MNTSPTPVALWESGRLARKPSARPFGLAREQWIEAALLVLSAIVFAVYVSVLEQDVHRSEMRNAEQHARAVAEVACEAAHPAESRAACLALLDGDVPAIAANDATGAPDEQAAAPRAGATSWNGATTSVATLQGDPQ